MTMQGRILQDKQQLQDMTEEGKWRGTLDYIVTDEYGRMTDECD